MSEPRGVVFDLGYQHYDGPREGRVRARKALWLNGVRTALGLGRGSRAKVLPSLLFIAAIAPAVILALVARTIDQIGVPGVEIPGHSDYYQIVSVILLLFSAIIAPELLCPDRRDGVIYLYLVRPLTTTDYVAARWLAFFAITLGVVYSGQVILLIGLTLAAAQPLDYLRDTWLEVPRFLAAGLALAVFTTTIPMAVSAFTTRRAYAAAFVIGLYFISAPVAGILTECQFEHREGREVVIGADGPAEDRPTRELVQGPCEPLAGEGAKWFALVDIGQVPIHVSDLITNEESEARIAMLARELPAYVPIGWYLLLTGIPALGLWWRYRSM